MQTHGSRPGPLIAASVLMIIFGGMTVVGSGCLGMITFMPNLIKLPGPLAEENLFGLDERIVKDVPSYPFVEGGSYVTSTVLGIGILAAGIGVFMLSERSRVLGIVLAAMLLLLELSHSLYNAVVVIPVQNRLDAEEMHVVDDLTVMTWGGLGVGIVISLAIWLTIISLLRNPNVWAACNGEFEEPRRRLRRDWDDDENDNDAEEDRPARPRPPSDTGITDRSRD